MQFYANHWYHVYNRGNNSQRIFFSKENYLFFLKKVRRQIKPHAHVMAYCLMPNHFHFLLKVKPASPSDGWVCHPMDKEAVLLDKKATLSTDPIAKPAIGSNHPLCKKVGVLLRSYAQAINKQQNRTGSLFQSKTKAKNLSEGNRNYAQTCFHYIHQNPLKAGLAYKPKDWPFSSYRDFAGLRDGTLPAKDLAFEAFAIKDGRYFTEKSQETLAGERVRKIF